MNAASGIGRLLRIGRQGPREVRLDWLLLVGFALLLIATGIGLRDPWPADEPRFALIARDMVASGEWLLPRVGGQIYADKPPLFFWMIALGLELTGSLSVAFLLPSLCAALGCVLLVYDLARRLWSRETGLAAGLALLMTVQFVWQARQAQIDAVLCFWTTLSLYGLLRHLLLGPHWRCYAAGWAAAGLGVITKGVGFLPLAVLLPFVLLRPPRWVPRPAAGGGARWLIGPLAFLIAVGIWLVPVLLAARSDPAVAAYRDEILLRQTVERYAHAWHHREPFWYFLLEVIPWLWLPLTLLLPWLASRWRAALRGYDLRIALLLAWIVLVVLFFSLSSGKRGVYVLPALPALALACAPYLIELAARRVVQRAFFLLAAAIGALCMLAAGYLSLRPQARAEIVTLYEIDPAGPLLLLGLVVGAICVIVRPQRGIAAFAGVLTVLLLMISFWINPMLNATRSGSAFIARVERSADPQRELALLGFREQYLLHIRREIVHFGHARWRDAEQELDDAALWLASAGDRQLLISAPARARCFSNAAVRSLGYANRREWFLVADGADAACVARGRANAARRYGPPGAAAGMRLRS